ncbi:sensor histidine kinase [Kineococcus auxinigenes]|uniref:sensor histidine kinase n=1 Tax=unclassified Kineococcus TaxID=2621656 RepID=UPI003D7E16E3
MVRADVQEGSTVVRRTPTGPERALGAAERAELEVLRQALACAPDAFVSIDDDGVLTDWNQAAADLLGWERTEVLGLPMTEVVVPPELRRAHDAGLARYRATGERTVSGRPVQVEALHRDGTRVPVEITIWPTWVAGERRCHAFLRDLRPRRAAEQALARSEELSRTTFDASPSGIAVLEADGTIVQVNPALAALLGRGAGELLGLTTADLVHPEDLAVCRVAGAQADAAPGSAVAVEHRLRRADAGHLLVRSHVTTVLTPTGEQRRVVQMEDVTERRDEQERTRRRSRVLLTTVRVQQAVAAAGADRAAVLQAVADGAVAAFEAADGAVVELLEAGQLRYAATAGALAAHAGLRLPAAGSLSGTAIEQGLSVVCEDTATGPRVDAEACERTGVRSTCTAPLVSGNRTVGVLKVSSGTAGAFTAEDAQLLQLLAGSLAAGLRHADDAARNATLLAECTAALEALEMSEQRFRMMFDGSPLGMVLTSLDAADAGDFLQANAAMAEITGHSPQRLSRMGLRDLQHPWDAADGFALTARLVAGELDTATTETRFVHADGRTLWVRLRSAVVRDEQGDPLYLVAQVEDVTQRLAEQAQLAERNRELEAANQLKLDLIGMLGHEIANPLASIQGYSELAVQCWDQLEEADRRRSAEAVHRGAQRLDTILREVLAMVSVDAGQLSATPEPVRVRDVVDAALASVPGAATAVDCPPDLVASVQPGHLEQVLVNLLSNAVKYGAGATAVRAEAAGDRVLVHVDDAGPGVPEEFRGRLFERMARADATAGTVRGTGLGLYIVRELLLANGGDVRHAPRPGGGSVFTVELPAARRG